MVKDKNSIPAVVWKRRIAKILSWWARGRSNLPNRCRNYQNQEKSPAYPERHP